MLGITDQLQFELFFESRYTVLASRIVSRTLIIGLRQLRMALKSFQAILSITIVLDMTSDSL